MQQSFQLLVKTQRKNIILMEWSNAPYSFAKRDDLPRRLRAFSPGIREVSLLAFGSSESFNGKESNSRGIAQLPLRCKARAARSSSCQNKHVDSVCLGRQPDCKAHQTIAKTDNTLETQRAWTYGACKTCAALLPGFKLGLKW